MIDDRAMGGLRMAAALVHAVPDLALDVTGPATVLHVGHGAPVDGPGHHHLTPCGFRAAVGEAHRLRRSGRAVGLRGFGPDERPALRLRSSAQTKVLAGGIILFRCGGQERVAAATLLDPDACAVELVDLEPDLELRLHHDEALAVTILHAGAPETELDRAMRAVVAALAACAAAELLAEVATGVR